MAEIGSKWKGKARFSMEVKEGQRYMGEIYAWEDREEVVRAGKKVLEGETGTGRGKERRGRSCEVIIRY